MRGIQFPKLRKVAKCGDELTFVKWHFFKATCVVSFCLVFAFPALFWGLPFWGPASEGSTQARHEGDPYKA